MSTLLVILLLVFFLGWVVVCGRAVVRAARRVRPGQYHQARASRVTVPADRRFVPLVTAARVAIVVGVASGSFFAARGMGIDRSVLGEFVLASLLAPLVLPFWALVRAAFLSFAMAYRERFLELFLCRVMRLGVATSTRCIEGVVYLLDEMTYAMANAAVPVAFGVVSVLGHLGLVALPHNEPPTRLWLLFVPLPSTSALGYVLAIRVRNRAMQWFRVPDRDGSRITVTVPVPRAVSSGRLAVAVCAFATGLCLASAGTITWNVAAILLTLAYGFASCLLVIAWSLCRAFFLRRMAEHANQVWAEGKSSRISSLALFMDEVTLAWTLGYPPLGVAAAYWFGQWAGWLRLPENQAPWVYAALVAIPVVLCVFGLTAAGLVRRVLAVSEIAVDPKAPQ